MISRADCLAHDEKDALKHLRARYVVPPDVIYLDGNSLGLMPKAVPARIEKTLQVEWARDLITSWNVHGWFHLPRVMGNKIARLVGGGDGNVIVADTISINLFKLLTSALPLLPKRRVILTDNGNFPSDLYVAQGLNRFLDNRYEFRVVDPDAVADAISDDVAVVMLTEVDYRTARCQDMAEITRLAHAKGCLTIWDLSHSAGAIPVDLLGAQADFAVGCTYKYLNGGPGAPAFLFVHPRHQENAVPALVGWWGHASPFVFSADYVPAEGVIRQQCGTQGILSMQALDAALDQWADIDMHQLQAKSHSLCSTFMALVEEGCSRHGLVLAGPRTMALRGSHVSFHCPEGYAVMQALIARGVIGDFRAPDMIRFGFAPCYNTHAEVFDAAQHLADIMQTGSWNRPAFLARKAVT